MEYKNSLKGMLFFELMSLFGRFFLNGKRKFEKEGNYLNLGSGSNTIKGFINADFYRPRFWKKKKHKIDWMIDFRFPLNCDNNVFDGVYSSHTLEHLYPSQVQLLLSEIYRVMKVNAVMRITIPDLKKYIDFYINKRSSNINFGEFDKKFRSGCNAINYLTQNYYHLSVWDYDEMKQLLMEIGFRNIKEMSLGESSDDKLKIDIPSRDWETLYIECIK